MRMTVRTHAALSGYSLPPPGSPGPLGSLSFQGFVGQSLVARPLVVSSTGRIRGQVPIHSQGRVLVSTGVAAAGGSALLLGPRCPVDPRELRPLDSTHRRWSFSLPYSVRGCRTVDVGVEYYPRISPEGNYREWFGYGAS